MNTNTSQMVAPLIMLGNGTNNNAPAATLQCHSPTSPFSPISPTPTANGTPQTPFPADTKSFTLSQSITNLAIDIRVVGLNENISHAPNNSMDRCRPRPSSTFEANDLLLCLSSEHRQQLDYILSEFGYKKVRKICNTLQGTMYEASIIDPDRKAKTGFERVVVKRTSKQLHLCGEAVQDDLRVIVEENIIKEAMILKHLTKDNRPNGGYIAKFVDFFETDDDYYLIMEYVGDYNLKEFVAECHKYIRDRKLKIKEYKKVVKFLFWQICVMVHGMHFDMKCCHLDLCLENIMVREGNFIIDENTGNVTINPNAAVKLCDFGLAEIFDPSTNDFTVGKWGLKDSFETTPPMVYNEQLYNGMKSDIWSLGVILHQLSTGKSLYQIPDEKVDAGYHCILNDQLAMHLEVHKLSKFSNKKMLNLMINMLKVDEQQRYSAFDVLNHPWFDAYYKRYALRIQTKSKSQKMQLKNQRSKMRNFPYYSL